MFASLCLYANTLYYTLYTAYILFKRRWPGASLIMIKGYKHLQECAYIGDDSSEEVDELLEANRLGLLSNDALNEKIKELKLVEGKTNDPGKLGPTEKENESAHLGDF